MAALFPTLPALLVREGLNHTAARKLAAEFTAQYLNGTFEPDSMDDLAYFDQAVALEIGWMVARVERVTEPEHATECPQGAWLVRRMLAAMPVG